MAETLVANAEKTILRTLAKRMAEIAAEPLNLQRRMRWIKHNKLQTAGPMILVSPEGSWPELLTEKELECRTDLARSYERNLRERIYHWEVLKDDVYLSDCIWAFSEFVNTGWGLMPETMKTETQRGSFAYKHPLEKPENFSLMKKPVIEFDEKRSQENLEIIQDIFGDILKVKLARTIWDMHVDTSFVDTLVALRGNEQIMLDMYERPQWLHEVLGFMTDAVIEQLKWLEKNGTLEIVNDATWNGIGSYYITDELPAKGYDGRQTRLVDLWGVTAAQEYAGVSPEMHYEFGLKYEIKILELLGLNSYGCCEPLDRKLNFVKQIPRLRRVSISPWADVRSSAEQLCNKYIFSWKPSPFPLAEPQLDTKRVRAEITEAVKVAKEHNCIFEMTLKDTHTCRNEPDRFQQWMAIAREVVDSYW
jgi:hypothetical protein